MKKVLAFSGSPRANSNSEILLENFNKGAKTSNAQITWHNIKDLKIKACTGCLRCNIVKRCTLRDDDWNLLINDILEADIIVFATPVYFHHVPGPMKVLLDRFRSFVHVGITETGLTYTPHEEWEKDFVLLLTMGTADKSDAKPIMDMFEFICKVMGEKNNLHAITATRLAVARQILRTEEELREVYIKMNINPDLAKPDYRNNINLLDESFDLGSRLGSAK